MKKLTITIILLLVCSIAYAEQTTYTDRYGNVVGYRNYYGYGSATYTDAYGSVIGYEQDYGYQTTYTDPYGRVTGYSNNYGYDYDEDCY